MTPADHVSSNPEDCWHPRQVARTVVMLAGGVWVISTVLLTDGSAFETKVFGPGPDGLEHEYEIRVRFREQAMVNHVNAVDALRTGRALRLPRGGPDT